MRLFGRKDDEGQEPEGLSGERIAEFWVTWDQLRPQLDTLLAAGDTQGATELLAPAVAALDPGLVAEIGPGRNAVQSLVITAAGDPELRSLAHRWAASAPQGDFMWEFFPSRQANPRVMELTVEVGGADFAFDQLMFGLRVPHGTPRVDISAYHPLFADLDADARMEATLLALDWLLGEDEVARWVGEITPATFQPIDAVAAVHLPAVVADVAGEWAEEQWVMLEGQAAGGAALVATARYPLRPVDHPLFDQHIEITLPYTHRDEKGLPAGASERALREFDDKLAKQLAKGGDAVLAAHVSADGLRVAHLYADPAGGAAELARELAGRWKEGGAKVEVDHDPGWIAVSPFLS
ncbi:DUF695 domain-containing protein [Nonomuraea sp. NPDC050310]|uniref:DUF695 domain-containing protein n=1 Tax=unclassified Nonomuraea TaxID=2593643 RepID=UPI00340D6A6C